MNELENLHVNKIYILSNRISLTHVKNQEKCQSATVCSMDVVNMEYVVIWNTVSTKSSDLFSL